MSNWSSYKEQQLLTESWRSYLKDESEIDEGVLDRVSQAAKGAVKGGKEAWAASAPKEMHEYPANPLVQLMSTIQTLAKRTGAKIDNEAILEEFEAMLAASNFVVKEDHPEALMLGAPLAFAVKPGGALDKFMGAIGEEALKIFFDQVAKAGFSDESLVAVAQALGVDVPHGTSDWWPAGRLKSTDKVHARTKKKRQAVDIDGDGKEEEATEVGVEDDAVDADTSERGAAAEWYGKLSPEEQKKIGFQDASGMMDAWRAATQETPGDDEEKETKEGESKIANMIQSALDVAGLAGVIPAGEVIATPATVASLGMNLFRGKTGPALIDLLALVPVAGKYLKAGSKAAKIFKAAKGTKGAKEIATTAEAAIDAYKLTKGIEGLYDLVGKDFVHGALSKGKEGGGNYIDATLDVLSSEEMLPEDIKVNAMKLKAEVEKMRAEMDQNDWASFYSQTGHKPRTPVDGNRLNESEIHRWQQIAGINPRAI